MSFVRFVETAVPRPQAGPTPRAPAPTVPPAVPLRADVIARPVSQPSPGSPNLAPPGPGAGLPLLVAAGLIAGGGACALPALEAAVGAMADGAQSVASAVASAGGFAKVALREFATEYRAAAGQVADLKLTDPHVLGKTLGAQAWTGTEEVVRGAIVGAGFAGAAWAVEKLGAAGTGAIAPSRAHAGGR